jgi:hypothetical protein
LPVAPSTGVFGSPSAVCFLLHFPSSRLDWPLASTLPFGVPTFLDRVQARPRPPGRLTVEFQSGRSRVRLLEILEAGPAPSQHPGRHPGRDQQQHARQYQDHVEST